jgi:uncharacterized protein (DUF305 family)
LQNKGSKEMTLFKTSIFTAAALMAAALPSFAQDAMEGHDMSAMGDDSAMAAPQPEICMSAGDVAGDMSMTMEHEMDQAHMDLMAGMDQTNKQMMNGMMAEDIDVAFVCGMIAHHQGAINMATAELEHGDNQWAKDMAQKVIDAQEKEIADMVSWLEGEGASE